MNIVFWSPYSGTAVSSASLVLSALAVIDKHMSCALMQLHFGGNGLFKYFIPESDVDQIAVFENTGIDALLRATHGGVASKDTVADSAFGYLDNHLNVFTATKIQAEKVYQSGFADAIGNAFCSLNNTFQLNFIDTPAGVNIYSDKALLLADLIVVCLPQTAWRVEEFIKKYNFPKEKVLYLLTDYDECQTMNAKKLTRMLHQSVFKNSNYAVMPHCAEYANSADSRTVLQFLLRNVKCQMYDTNFPFVSECRKTVDKILKYYTKGRAV